MPQTCHILQVMSSPVTSAEPIRGTASSQLETHLSSVRHVGRFDVQALDLSALLSRIALCALAFVPVLHAPAAMIFLLAGIAMAVLQPMRTAAMLLEARFVLILPAFCLASVVWSIYPALSLRFAFQQIATFVIAILIAKHLSLDAILRTLLIALLPLVILSIAFGAYRADTGALTGLFGSKNEMAGMAVILSILSIGVAATRAKWTIRVPAFAGIVTGIVAMVLAQSLGGLAYFLTALLAFVTVLIARKTRITKRMTALLFSAMLLVLLIVNVAANVTWFADAFVDLTGKDLTLTGRVDLWQVAMELIKEKPLLGVGFQAFWVNDHAPAEALWAAFGIESRSGFNFHNAYLSNAVEIGIIGVTMQLALIASATLFSGRLALLSHEADTACLFAICVMLVAVTLFEVPVFFQFNLHTVIMITIVVYSSDSLRRLDSARSAR